MSKWSEWHNRLSNAHSTDFCIQLNSAMLCSNESSQHKLHLQHATDCSCTPQTLSSPYPACSVVSNHPQLQSFSPCTMTYTPYLELLTPQHSWLITMTSGIREIISYKCTCTFLRTSNVIGPTVTTSFIVHFKQILQVNSSFRTCHVWVKLCILSACSLTCQCVYSPQPYRFSC